MDPDEGRLGLTMTSAYRSNIGNLIWAQKFVLNSCKTPKKSSRCPLQSKTKNGVAAIKR